jgi:hypothetical protein
LKALIEGDTALQELAKSPLMLSIMVLAYEGVTVEDLPNTDVVEERRKQLFDAYITRMFRRPTRLKVEQRYSENQTKHWLIWLAQRMVQQSQTVFLIEGMQPTWLPTNYKKILYRLEIFLIGGLIYGMIYGMFFWLIYGLIYGHLLGHILGRLFGPALGRLFGLIGGLIFGLISAFDNPEIRTVETLKWSWKEAKNSLIRPVILGLILGLIGGLIGGLIEGQIEGLILGLILGLIGGLILGLIGGLVGGMKGSAIATKTIPNQGIYRTAMNTGIMGLIVGLISGLLIGQIFGLMIGQILGLMIGQILGLFYGLIAVIFGGGKDCIQHLTLRLILYAHGYIPWNYARFLDYATEHIFLQKVGGGYIFIHRLLLEHFAEMELEVERKSS